MLYWLILFTILHIRLHYTHFEDEQLRYKGFLKIHVSIVALLRPSELHTSPFPCQKNLTFHGKVI